MLVWALPQLGAPVLPSTVSKLASAAVAVMTGGATAGQVAVLVAGLARLGYQPSSQEWLEGLWGVLGGGVLRGMTGHELAMLGWGLGQLGLQAPEAFLQLYAEAAAAAGVLPPQQQQQQQVEGRDQDTSSSSSSSGRDGSSTASTSSSSSSSKKGLQYDAPVLVHASMVLYCFTRCSAGPPPPAFMQHWFTATQLPLPEETPNSSSSSRRRSGAAVEEQPGANTSSQQQEQQPTPSTSGRPFYCTSQPAAAAASGLMRQQSAVSWELLSSLMSSVARSQASPPVPWLQAILWQLQLQPPAHPPSPQHLVNFLWSLASMRVLPSRAWMVGFCARVTPVLPAFKPVDVTMLLWGFAKLGFMPPAGFWQVFWGISGKLLGAGRPVDVAVALWAVAELNQLQPAVQPPMQWLARVLAEVGVTDKSASQKQLWQQQQRVGLMVKRRVLLLEHRKQQQQVKGEQQQQEELLEVQRLQAAFRLAQQRLEQRRQQRKQQRQNRGSGWASSSSSSSRGWSGWSWPHLVLVCHSMARLGVVPPQCWLQGLVAAVQQQAEEMPAQVRWGGGGGWVGWEGG